MITTVHKPFDDRIFQKEAKSLAKRYEISVIAPAETISNKTCEGVKLFTVKKSRNKIFHLATMWRVFQKSYKERCDVYHCHELGSFIIGLILKKTIGSKVIYDVHEHWPSQIPHDIGISGNSRLSDLIQNIVLNVELYCSKHSDALITVSDSVSERFIKIGLNPTVIPNVPVLSYLDDIPSHSIKNKRELVYMGGKLQASHGIKECVNALKVLKKQYSDVILTIIGNLDFDLKKITSDEEILRSITITGVLPYDEMYERIHQGEIGLVLFKPDYYNKYIGLPNKLFDYMICGLPVIASDFPEIHKVVAKNKCGILVDPMDVEEISKAIQYLFFHQSKAKEMGNMGQIAVKKHYNWGKMEEKLFDLYEIIT